MTDRAASYLSLAAKAGKVKSGETAAEEALRAGRAYLLIIAADASENTKKKFRNLARSCRTPVLEYADRETIGHMIGKEYRSTAAVTDEGLANLIRRAARENAWDSRRDETYGKNQGT